MPPRARAARRPTLSRIPLPRPRLLALLLVACVPLALGAISGAFVALAVAIVASALALAAIDAYATPAPGRVLIARVADPQLSIGVGNHVALRVRNPFVRPLRALLVDSVPTSFDVDRRRIAVEVAARDEAEVRYVTRPRHRGSFQFGDVHLRLRGPLDLVEKQGLVAASAAADVYPDLHEIRRYELTLRRGLAYDAGQRRARVPGAGTVFERLREYVPDDDPRSISWTATARRGKPISVEYETERQQRIQILLDAGRMMSSTLGGLTKLDHAVNTALMLSYVAIAGGDEVGLLGFADTVRGYAVPRRGRRQFLRLTEELRKIEVTTTEPDYRAAFEFLRARSGRRSLVVLFTDLVDEEASRSLVAAVTRLAGHNLVLCCLLADPQLAETADRSPSSTTELYEKVVAQEVRDARVRALAILRQRGVHTIDVPAERLTVATIQRYLELKRRSL
ncbi:MAG TPA: DUF58 domain-containing protein [Candidatus Limnocylindria bacterium]|nr:DUF58 domain-containing protein [Candidatus Limnocylindria bacterium]